MIKKLVEKYNKLDGKKVSRAYLLDFTKEIFDYLPEENEVLTEIFNKIHSLLDRKKAGFYQITLSKKYDINAAAGLNAARHTGIAKEALTECGRLKAGYKYLKGGKIVKIESAKPKTKTAQISALLKKFKASAKKEAKAEQKPGPKDKKYKLGAMYSSDFDYYGLLSYAEKLTTKTPLRSLEKLHNSFEDVNLHTIAKPLWDIIALKTEEKKKTDDFNKKDKWQQAYNKNKTEPEKLKKRILNLKSKLGLKGYMPEITQGLNGVLLADGHSILTDEERLLFDLQDDAEGLNAAAKDVEEEVNKLILERIKTGESLPPWKKTWANKSPILAQNFETKKPYSGTNSMILNIILGSLMPTPYYLTFLQVKKLGGKVKKGAKGIPLIYWNFFYKIRDLSSNGAAESQLLSKIIGFKVGFGKKAKTITADNYKTITLNEKQVKSLNLTEKEVYRLGFLNEFKVFNIADTEGIEFNIPEPESKTPKERIALAESIVASFKDKPKILPHSEDAFYAPAKDTISILSINKFDTAEEYYSTLFHELIHSTMHKSRLNREEKYKDKEKESQYAFEELIAELGASYLCGLAGILDATHLNQASYLKGWHKKLQERVKTDKDFFVFATREAQKAVDYIIKDWDSEKEVPKETIKTKFKIGDKFYHTQNDVIVVVTEIDDTFYRLSVDGKKHYSDAFTEHLKFERYVKEGVYKLLNPGSKKSNKTYSYHLTARPFSIGTYPLTDTFLRFEEDGSRFGKVVYSEKLTYALMNQFELAPIEEVLALQSKTIYHTFGKNVYSSKINIIKNAKKVNVVELNFTTPNNREHKENYAGALFLWKIEMGEYFFEKPKEQPKYDAKTKARAKAKALKLKLKLKVK